jgi:hypothetical protein
MTALSLKNTTAAQLDEAAAVNLATHMSWVQERTDGMLVEADEQLIMVDCGLATDTFNTICRANLTAPHSSF